MYWQVWIVYLIAAVGFTVIWWRLTGKMSDGFIRRVLRLLVAAVLFIPAQSVPGKEDLAPAFIVALFASLTGEEASAQAGIVPLSIGISLMLAVVAITSLVQFVKNKAEPAQAESTPAE